MKVSLNWVKQYVDFELPPVDELVERIGMQLGAVEEVENLAKKYHGVVVAKIVSCRKHEGSDHLNVCLIDDGGITPGVNRDANGHVQVVCGAPNVREGLLVAWLPPGSTVPESVGKDPFVLEARELRGEMSNGMLVSPRELALGDNHDGIMELNTDDAKPGDDFAKVYALDDHIVDIENKMFTHRPDCFGELGVAREIAGILGKPFHSPDWYRPDLAFPGPEADELRLEIRNEIPELVPRFVAVAMRDVELGPSPVWLQATLARMGLRSINNIVDYTNYYMLLTGQPIHAYDYDKVKALSDGDGAVMVVRMPHSGEKITLLNGKTIEPRAEAMMVATDKQLICVGGAMGGADTEVDEHTKHIIIEAANWDMYSMRRTAMAHGIFTDAVTRFTKGQSPLQNLAVVSKIVDDIRRTANGKVASSLVDINQLQGREWVHPPVPVSVEFINVRLGFALSAGQMKTLLENVEFHVDVSGDDLTVTAPFWRTDIEIREDVVEEIGRLYGFDKLPLELPQRSIRPAEKNPLLELKAKIRATLATAGANEVLTYSFVHGDLLQKVGQDKDQAFEVGNALSPDLQYYRLSLTPSLLDKVHANIKAGYDEFALFEIGKSHNLAHATDDDGLPLEFEMLDLVYARSDKLQKPGAAFYEARKFLTRLANEFGLQLDYRPFEAEEDYQVAKPYDFERSAKVFVKDTDIALGMVGEYRASVRKALKLPVHTAGFGIGITQFTEAAKTPTIPWYRPLPRFPKVTQDITLKVPAEVPFQALYWFVEAEKKRLAPEQTLSMLPGVADIYQRPDDTAHKQVSLRITIASYEQTLTDAEVSKLLDAIAAAAKDKFGAERI